MKKLVVVLVLLLMLAGVFGVTPYYLGIKAQESLKTQHDALADTFYFDVVSHDYQRGWLSSTETIVLRFHPNILAKLDKNLPENIKVLFNKPITLVNHVQHGLFADGIKPVRAVVQTEFQYDTEVQKTLARFFGEQIPVQMRNVIALDGSGKLSIQMAAFDYEELSGIKINWQGMNTEVDYANGYTNYQTHFVMPSLHLQLADKGSLKAEGLSILMHSHDGKNNITLGSSQTQLNRFAVSWSEDIAYDVRLNELVNMITNLQIGAFINPTGTIAPNEIVLNQLNYTTQTDEIDDNFINSEGKFSFEKLQYGEENYGPLNTHIAAEHLDSQSLTALKQRWTQITNTQQNNPQANLKDLALAAVKQEGAGIFTNNPVFKIKNFDFATPQGQIKIHGELSFQHLTAPDLNDLATMIKKTRADIQLDVSQNLVESIAISQLRGLFTVENPNSVQEQKEISDTIRLLTHDTINSMQNNGYLNQTNGNIQTRFVLDDGRVSLNGKTFEVQSSDEALAELEAQTASTPNLLAENQLTPTASLPAAYIASPVMTQ